MSAIGRKLLAQDGAHAPKRKIAAQGVGVLALAAFRFRAWGLGLQCCTLSVHCSCRLAHATGSVHSRKPLERFSRPSFLDAFERLGRPVTAFKRPNHQTPVRSLINRGFSNHGEGCPAEEGWQGHQLSGHEN